MVVGVQLIRSASPLPDDASIGVLFVGFLALAVVVMSAQSGSGAGDLTRFLFGSINAVDSGDLRTLVVVTVITLAGVIVLHRALLVGTFDATQARLTRVPAAAHALRAARAAGAVDRRLVRDGRQPAGVRLPDRDRRRRRRCSSRACRW